MKRVEIKVTQELDGLGDPEEFTWDLLPVVDPQLTRHLDETGLPRTGTRIVPGMILVGKIGKSASFHEAAQPSALEVQGLAFATLSSLYGHQWKNGSCYATEDHRGTVERAYFSREQGRLTAVVELVRDSG